MDVAISNAGTGPLTKVLVKPYLRENQHALQTIVRVLSGSSLIGSTGPRTRRQHLLNLPSAAAYSFVVAAKDEYDVWSESRTFAFTPSNFIAGSTQASIGSGTTDIELLESPGIAFPDLSVGSGSTQVLRTVIGSGFFDETRRAQMSKSRTAFRVKLHHMDEIQAQLLQRFYSALNGPMSPFYFSWRSPTSRNVERYLVRFREPSMADELVTTSLYDASFSLIELPGTGLGISL